MSQFHPPSPAFMRGMASRSGVSSSGSRTPPVSRRRHDLAGLMKPKKSGEDGSRKSLLEAIFPSKRKSPSNANANANGPPTANRTPNPAAVARGVEILHSIFPKWEAETLQVVLEANGFIMEDTITAVLGMEQAEDDAKSLGDAGVTAGSDGNWPVKNPLPDDFLRLPDDDGEVVKYSQSEDGVLEDDECDESEREEKSEEVAMSDAADEIRSDRSNSTLAEDDGTLYGKEFDDDSASTDEVITPVLDDAAMRANQKIVADSMNQKFLPVELRNERSSIFDIAHIDVIKKSKLDLSEAEKRIRHREPHLVFELLSKASEIYRSGVISSQELDYLRSMILSRIQPTKMLMDMTMNMNGMISDHEWHLLILKAKGIRHALCIRIFREESKPARNSGHMEYIVRVVDVESGVVWFTRKRFRELYKLHRKLSRLSGPVNECVFPTRRGHGRNSPNQLAYDRAPVLENFLRTTAALVAPSPLTFLHGVALKQLQQFLEVPHVGILERNRTQPISRELRVFVYHTVNDLTSPEGKACQKFLAKMKQNGFSSGKNVLDEIGDILDGVQEYMLEHRFEEMELIVQRLMKQILSGNAGNPAMGRHSSFVSLMTTDAVSNQDKLQQLLSDAIRHELEDRICVPLMYDLTQYLRRHVQHEERQFRHRVFQLKGKPQSYFGIPMDKISLSSWRSVVDVIKEVDGAFLPLDKMRKLVATAHQIHALYKAERTMYLNEPPRLRRRNSTPMAGSFCQTLTSPTPMNRMLSPTSSSSNRSSRGMTVGDESEAPMEIAAGEHEQKEEEADNESETIEAAVEDAKPQEEDVLSGDDFLPIFIYVIVHSDLEAPILTQVLLNRLCDPEKRRSESGYYLATFEAALHHILSLELPGAKSDGL